jgi:hypothetical protein
MERFTRPERELRRTIMINKIINKPRKKYAMVLAFTEKSNEGDLTEFSKADNNLILKADKQGS